jgi:hypothetical protein
VFLHPLFDGGQDVEVAFVVLGDGSGPETDAEDLCFRKKGRRIDQLID